MNKKQKIGQIKQLFISSTEEKKRIFQENIYVDEEGIVSDKYHNTNQERAILISPIHAYELMKEKDIEARYGQLGENILVDFNPYSLKEGTQLFIGDSIIEITIECTICKLLTKIDNKVPKLLKNDRGVFAKVIKEGVLTIGDDITILN
jgi:MOSC domain-containing protein YiiM